MLYTYNFTTKMYYKMVSLFFLNMKLNSSFDLIAFTENFKQ